MGIGGGVRAFEAGFPVVGDFGMDKDCQRTVAEKSDGILHFPPFVVMRGDGEPLGGAIVAGIGLSVLLFESPDIFIKRLSLRSPADEDAVSLGFDEPESSRRDEGRRLIADRLG